MPAELTIFINQKHNKGGPIPKIEIDFKLCYKSTTLLYYEYVVQGYLFKEVQKPSVLGKRKLKRYFVMDHVRRELRVHEDASKESSYKVFPYIDFQSIDFMHYSNMEFKGRFEF